MCDQMQKLVLSIGLLLYYYCYIVIFVDYCYIYRYYFTSEKPFYFFYQLYHYFLTSYICINVRCLSMALRIDIDQVRALNAGSVLQPMLIDFDNVKLTISIDSAIDLSLSSRVNLYRRNRPVFVNDLHTLLTVQGAAFIGERC